MRKKTVGKHIYTDVQLELKLLYRSISFWVLAVIWFVLLTLFIISVPSAWRTGNAFTTSGWVTQVMITGGIFLGIIRSSTERKEYCEEIYYTVYNAALYRYVSKIIVIFIMGIFILISGSITVFLSFFLHDVVGAYYLPSMAYIALYWVIPFAISGIMGLFIGVAANTKAVYPLAFMLSIALGPLVPKLAEPLMLGGGGILSQYYNMFNVGQMDPNSMISESYGYCLNTELWIARLCILSGAVILFVNRAVVEKRKKILKISLILISLILIASGYIGANCIFKIQYNKCQDAELIAYYRENPEPEFSEVNDDDVYEIEGYDIILDDGLSFEISADIEVNIWNASKPMVFTLFHGFVINECNIDGHECEYETQGDALIIHNKGSYTGDHVLHLTYKGRPPLNLYKASDKWVLPGIFAWIPEEYVGKALEAETMATALFNYPAGKKDTLFKLKYLGKNDVFCSLNRTNKNYWEGISSGITICSGWFDEKDEDGISVIYPILYPENVGQAVNLMQNLNSSVPIIYKEMLGETVDVSVKKIFVFPSILQNNLGEGIYILNDHVILCIYMDNGGYLIEEADGVSLLDFILKTDGWDDSDYYFKQIFEYMYLDNLISRGVSKSKQGLSFESIIDYIGNDKKSLAEAAVRAYQFQKSLDTEEQVAFFKRFLNLLNKGVSSKESVAALESIIG